MCYRPFGPKFRSLHWFPLNFCLILFSLLISWPWLQRFWVYYEMFSNLPPFVNSAVLISPKFSIFPFNVKWHIWSWGQIPVTYHWISHYSWTSSPIRQAVRTIFSLLTAGTSYILPLGLQTLPERTCAKMCTSPKPIYIMTATVARGRGSRDPLWLC